MAEITTEKEKQKERPVGFTDGAYIPRSQTPNMPRVIPNAPEPEKREQMKKEVKAQKKEYKAYLKESAKELKEKEDQTGFHTNHEDVIMSPVSGCHNGPWLAGYGLAFLRREDEPLS